ncbi:hypothetical protein [Desertimonas flava]|uniref:hypothetical protein n=1 Tax=Desertimonas flava TaxID=2064846 RepID=UPI0013C43471|nr:hypothetical protein [Desertimonas flava]
MSAVERRRRPALVSAVVLPLAAVAGLAAMAVGNGDGLAPGAAPTTTAVPTTGAPATTSAPTASEASTTAIVGFASGNEARFAAEGLIPSYIQSQFQLEVTDAACSKPASGETGQQFVCYALKPGDLVIALRATIGEERLVDLTLITDQQPTTTTTEPVATTTA